MGITIPQMQNAFSKSNMETPLPPARWGHMRHHVFYGALYHWFVMFRNGDYRNFRLHLSLSVTKEFRLYWARLLLMPWQAIGRRIFTLRIKHGGFPYHLVLLQLEHDSSLQKHSPFETKPNFLDLVIDGSAKGAPKHHHLVFKAHPLEDGPAPIRKSIQTMSKKYGISDRVHFVRGGKFAQLLNNARTTATVNSTAALQVLWRGIPLKVFGHAVYTQPEFVSEQPLPEFFAGTSRPDQSRLQRFMRGPPAKYSKLNKTRIVDHEELVDRLNKKGIMIDGGGGGNFKALFESIEADQTERSLIWTQRFACDPTSWLSLKCQRCG